MKYKLFLTGGYIRDELLGLKSKDVDYSVVMSNLDQDPLTAFYLFEDTLRQEGYEIFLTTSDCFTIRAKFPENYKYSGVADFVLARKEKSYIEGTRKPIVALGTLKDDLYRRDFTVNALAKDENGGIIDYFNGMKDIVLKSLDTPGDPKQSFSDDPLRIIRGMRFCITKGFTFCRDVRNAIIEVGMHGIEVVSAERIREELYKCFKFNTKLTLEYLNYMEDTLRFPLRSYIFDNTGIWLEPTTKE